MFWGPSLIFIHVPRTGGTLLTDIFGALPHVSKDVHKGKHLAASVVKSYWPDYWESARKIAVYRPNDEIAKSWYRHVQSSFGVPEKNADPEWLDFVARCHGMSFEDFSTKETMPTMEQYLDCDGIDVMTWDTAYETMRDVLMR